MKSFINKTFFLAFTIISALLSSVSSQNTSPGIFKGHLDIGNPRITGSVVYNPVNEEYIIEGAGYNIWFERDEFHYLYNKIRQ